MAAAGQALAVAIAAAFLDRDGVLIRDVGYPHRPADLILTEGAPAAVTRLNRAGRKVVVVTNQSGVARGLFSEARMHAFNDELVAALAARGAVIDAVYACPFHPEAIDVRYRHPDHPDRKPNPGMILRAIADLDLDPERSFLIGDQDSDMEAARRAGVASYRFVGGNLDHLVGRILASS